MILRGDDAANMKKNKYRLQPVVNERERARDEAARQLEVCHERLAEAERELARRVRAVELCREEQSTAHERMSAELSAGTAEARRLVAHRTHLSELRENEKMLIAQVEQQRSQVARAETEVERALQVVIEAAKELKVIEKHREGWRERVKREHERHEQKLSDEIGRIMYEGGRVK